MPAKGLPQWIQQTECLKTNSVKILIYFCTFEYEQTVVNIKYMFGLRECLVFMFICIYQYLGNYCINLQ